MSAESRMSERAMDMRAADFIERRCSSHWSDADEAALAAWLCESTAHRVAFLRLNSSWKRTERLIALRSPEPSFRPAMSRSRGRARLQFLRRDNSEAVAQSYPWLAYAASIASLLLLGWIAALYLLTPRAEIYSTPVGGREILTLRDGSRIELNTDTSVRVSLSAQTRSIVVEKGEVYFQVHHDAARPFIVTAQGHRVTDLGTQFSLRIDQRNVKVALLEGRVRFDAADQVNVAKPAVLTPGDVLVASVDRVSVKKEPLRDLLASMAWRRGLLVFHETTLADAAAEFNRYNQTKIVIRDPLAAKETINGMLPVNNLAEFASMAKNLFGLHAEIREDEILLTR